MDKPAAQAIRMKVAILGGKGPGAPVLAPPPTEAAWKLMVLPFPFSLAVAVDGFALCRMAQAARRIIARRAPCLSIPSS